MYRYSSPYAFSGNAGQSLNISLGRIEAAYRQEELGLLLYLLEMCAENFADRMARVRLVRPLHDHNISSSLAEKLAALRQRNQQLTARMLNLQAVLAKRNLHSRTSAHSRDYRQTLEGIRDLSFGIKEKIAQLASRQQMPRRVVNSQTERLRSATGQLKRATEDLATETIRLQAEVAAFEEECASERQRW